MVHLIMLFELFYKNDDVIYQLECSNENFNGLVDIIKIKLASNKILCLDLHGVTDLFHYTENISDLPICVISYVGHVARNQASMSIRKRLETNQITIGILVFNRPKITSKIQKNKIIGTKCWFLNLLSEKLKTKCIFMDDGEDHIDLVKLFGNKLIKSILITTKNKQTLKNIIMQLY